ncbi:MAG: hypothetical protein Q9188_002226 [Gyalolechia gomerana]
MPAWQPPAWFFGAISGGIVVVIILIGVVGGLLKNMKAHRLEKDLEANQAMPESKTAPAEMAEGRPSRGAGPIRRATEADLEFVDVDLRDPVIRNQSVYARIRDNIYSHLSKSSATRLEYYLKSAALYF